MSLICLEGKHLLGSQVCFNCPFVLLHCNFLKDLKVYIIICISYLGYLSILSCVKNLIFFLLFIKTGLNSSLVLLSSFILMWCDFLDMPLIFHYFVSLLYQRRTLNCLGNILKFTTFLISWTSLKLSCCWTGLIDAGLLVSVISGVSIEQSCLVLPYLKFEIQKNLVVIKL